ncbi:MAG: dehydratase [Alphaproteobacteria bacterium]|nr:MAG: dehydratase [Alphaproteobacteria bacterium]
MREPVYRTTLPLGQLLSRVGELEAVSDWMVVSQEMIDGFADLTGDRQFIHVDPVRARAETPFGGTIAHGFLTLSLLSTLAAGCVPRPAEAVIGINYGFDRIRFLAPVPSGSRIRGRFRLVESGERKPRELLSRHEVTVEIEGIETPALAANWLTLAVLGAPVADILGGTT